MKSERYEKERILILTAIIGSSFSEILKHDLVVPIIRSQALEWVAKNGRQKAVHLYVVEDKEKNANPLLFDTLEEAKRHFTAL